jgi:hypothetical protein
MQEAIMYTVNSDLVVPTMAERCAVKGKQTIARLLAKSPPRQQNMIMVNDLYR